MVGHTEVEPIQRSRTKDGVIGKVPALYWKTPSRIRAQEGRPREAARDNILITSRRDTLKQRKTTAIGCH
jgi:hypothetical protein